MELVVVPICQCNCTSQMVVNKCMYVVHIMSCFDFRVLITHLAMTKVLLCVEPVTALSKSGCSVNQKVLNDEK